MTDASPPETFATLLRAIRDRRNRSREWLIREMARRGAFYSYSYLREIELGGRHPPGVPVVLAIASSLDATAQPLLRLAIQQRGGAELAAATPQQVATLSTLAEHWSRFGDDDLARIEAKVLELAR